MSEEKTTERFDIRKLREKPSNWSSQLMYSKEISLLPKDIQPIKEKITALAEEIKKEMQTLKQKLAYHPETSNSFLGQPEILMELNIHSIHSPLKITFNYSLDGKMEVEVDKTKKTKLQKLYDAGIDIRTAFNCGVLTKDQKQEIISEILGK